jgi:sRNA-binding carbon storage regulator CsrA
MNNKNGNLILARKLGEVIDIFVGDILIQISIADITKFVVKLRCSADKDKVRILRHELSE